MEVCGVSGELRCLQDRLTRHLYNGSDRVGANVEFCVFDTNYIQKLTAADPDTESHFSSYFRKFIFLKLRSRRVAPDMVEDVCQETLLRVLRMLRQGSGITQPERFGAFVNSVCNRVFQELSHKQSRHPLLDGDAPEIADATIDLDRELINEQRRRMVAAVLDEMSPKDREILRLVFFEEVEREEICSRMAVDAGYLRVLLHRAKSKFSAVYLRRYGAAGGVLAILCCNGIALSLITSMGAD